MKKTGYTNTLKNNLELGEGQFIEFKEALDKNFTKEMVAFANATGGLIYIGITDRGIIKGIEVTNRLKSQIQDLARNCDPPIAILLTETENILTVEVKEGVNKPYSCSSGFYMRMGANSQKMNRDEILALAIKTGKIRYDEQICSNFDWKDFDDEKFDYFLGDTIAVEKLKSSIIFNNKGELLFPESDFGKRSEARNRLLVDLLASTDFMEKAGTGIKRVTDACNANQNECTFRFSDAFWVTMKSNDSSKVVDKLTDN